MTRTTMAHVGRSQRPFGHRFPFLTSTRRHVTAPPLLSGDMPPRQVLYNRIDSIVRIVRYCRPRRVTPSSGSESDCRQRQ